MSSKRNTAAIVGAIENAAAMPAGKHGIGDRARADFAAHHTATTLPRSTADKLADLAVLAEAERIARFNPFAAIDYKRANAGAIAGAHATLNVLREASPRNISIADAVAALEATVTP